LQNLLELADQLPMSLTLVEQFPLGVISVEQFPGSFIDKNAKTIVCSPIGGVQEALTEMYTAHLRALGSTDRGGGIVGAPPEPDVAALRGAVKKLRDTERAPRDAPKARRAAREVRLIVIVSASACCDV
jgi:hypothetical protein